VDKKSGNRIWTLGGKQNNFTDMSGGNATNFAWQHHARFTNIAQTQLTMFDNHNTTSAIGCVANCSRGRHVELDYQRKAARLISEFYHPENLISGFEGSYQTLSNDNVFLGWGANPTFTEHTPEGDCVLDVQFNAWRPDKGYPINYRAFKMNWSTYLGHIHTMTFSIDLRPLFVFTPTRQEHDLLWMSGTNFFSWIAGNPTWDPKIAAVAAGQDGQFKVYLSWNGATNVTSWQLVSTNFVMFERHSMMGNKKLITWPMKLTGNSTKEVTKPVITVPRKGFETEIPIKLGVSFVRAAALDSNGKVLGMTALIKLVNGTGNVLTSRDISRPAEQLFS
jgi:hypothetical protein